MTTNQFNRANSLRSFGYSPERVAADMGLTLAEYKRERVRYLARRRYEAPAAVRGRRRSRARRDKAIAELHASGIAPGIIAPAFGVSVRTVQKIGQRQRETTKG